MTTSENAGKHATLLAFGRLIKRLRIAADLTQEELAERASVSPRLISDLERGSTHLPRRDTVQLLADGLRLRGSDRDAFVALARGRSLVAAPDFTEQAPPRHALPHPPTRIVGRLQETAATTALLLDPEVRLLTLTGLGGVGKTRLALEVGHKVADAFPDGAIFIDLAPVRDPALVLMAIAQAFGVVPSREHPLRQGIVDTLHGKRLLLVLDNFEHLTVAATVVSDLLAATSTLKVLATSREPLHLRAEWEYQVGPLALPDLQNVLPLDELAMVPAVELFVRRAEAANRQFALTAGNARAIAEISVRLDGLPLAIELAATRVKVLSPSDLLSRLEQRLPLLTGGAQDLPLRQQALRATIGWSHELLSREEQILFRRLAVFVGGFAFAGAEYVGGEASSSGRGDASSVLDLLTALVDKSLVQGRDDGGGEQRFGMLETIREYGLECLAAVGEEAEIRRRHQTWCLDLAERAEPKLTGPDQYQWFSRLETEHDNLREALDWGIARRDAAASTRLGGALYRFWATHGHYEEGRRWLERALALEPEARTAATGHALIGLGVMVFFQGEYERAAELWEKSLSLFTALGDITGIAYSHGNLGLVADAQGDYERAVTSYTEALALFRTLEDRTYIGYMLHNLGLIAYFQGDYERATTLIEESLALVRVLDDQNGVAMTLGNLGLVAFAQGNHERARSLQEESLAIGRVSSNKPWLARGVEHFALIAAATGEPERAARLFAAAEALRAELGISLQPNDREFNERYIGEA
ncbi:MAG TPA: tetratricopeptide repeat protein, partial [Thermomicrobiales bacterium]|nr:tetratricopeptide repeat protein [Thermomicrobiales bacterium]